MVAVKLLGINDGYVEVEGVKHASMTSSKLAALVVTQFEEGARR
jgi:hypothetical protein